MGPIGVDRLLVALRHHVMLVVVSLHADEQFAGLDRGLNRWRCLRGRRRRFNRFAQQRLWRARELTNPRKLNIMIELVFGNPTPARCRSEQFIVGNIFAAIILFRAVTNHLIFKVPHGKRAFGPNTSFHIEHNGIAAIKMVIVNIDLAIPANDVIPLDGEHEFFNGIVANA